MKFRLFRKVYKVTWTYAEIPDGRNRIEYVKAYDKAGAWKKVSGVPGYRTCISIEEVNE